MSSVIKYGSARLLASDESSANTLKSISMVQNIDMGFSIRREEIRSIGYGGAEYPVVGHPQVAISFEYILSDLTNEELFGFPVTGSDVLDNNKSILNNIKAIDLAFVVTENQEFDRLSGYDNISVYLLKNCYIKSYSISLSPKGLPSVSVSFEGEDVIFKTFKNLSGYSNITIKEDTRPPNALNLVTNDGITEPTDGIGGGKIMSKVSGFDFSLDIDYKILKDFGTAFFKRKVNFPISARLSIDAYTSEIKEGELNSIFCQENLSKFALSFSRDDCDLTETTEKAGLLFLNARLNSQRYASSIGQVFQTSLDFDLNIGRDCGVFFVQSTSVGETFELESINGIVLMEESGESKVLTEALADMMQALSEHNAVC